MVRFFALTMIGIVIGLVFGAYTAPLIVEKYLFAETSVPLQKRKGSVLSVNERERIITMEYRAGFPGFPSALVKLTYDNDTRFWSLTYQADADVLTGARITSDRTDIPSVGENIIAFTKYRGTSVSYIVSEKGPYAE